MIAIDFILLTLLLLPPLIREANLLAFIGVITATINHTQINLQDLYNQKKYDLTWTGQVIYLEKYLNDIYGTGTAIYISNNALTSDTYIFNTYEANEELYLFNSSEFSNPTGPVNPLIDPEQVYLYNVLELSGLPVFIVYVPLGLAYDQAIMRNQIDKYRLPGKIYEIVEV